MGSHSKNSSLNRQSRAEHLDKLLDEALEQTFPASDPVAIDFERSGDSSGRDSAVEPDQSGRMRQQSVEKAPGAASIALPREQRLAQDDGLGARTPRSSTCSRSRISSAQRPRWRSATDVWWRCICSRPWSISRSRSQLRSSCAGCSGGSRSSAEDVP